MLNHPIARGAVTLFGHWRRRQRVTRADWKPGRRTRLAAGSVAVVVAGLTVTRAGHGPVADAVGGAHYAVLVYLVLALVAPRARAVLVAAVALGVCAGIELAQLTGVPAAAVELWGPARFLVGTTFQAVDLAAYALGATVAAVGDAAARRVRLAGPAHVI